MGLASWGPGRAPGSVLVPGFVWYLKSMQRGEQEKQKCSGTGKPCGPGEGSGWAEHHRCAPRLFLYWHQNGRTLK